MPAHGWWGYPRFRRPRCTAGTGGRPVLAGGSCRLHPWFSGSRLCRPQAQQPCPSWGVDSMGLQSPDGRPGFVQTCLRLITLNPPC